MTDRVQAALAHWRLEGATARLAAERENEVWKVQHGAHAYALRLHRPGYRRLAELRSELQWMAWLAQGGITVPAPLPAADGSLIAAVAGRQVSVLGWLDGTPAGAAGKLDPALDPRRLSFAIGREMARMHSVTDAWDLPDGFTRPDWGRQGLLGPDPLWGRFWEHPDLDAAGRALLLAACEAAKAALAELGPGADQGLIHADILGENVLVANGRPAFIDFDDCAFGYRTFELATWLLKFLPQPYAPEMRAGLLDGYAARRRVEAAELDLFLLLRALTYVGWIIPRIEEPGGRARSARMLGQALELARNYLQGRP